VTGWQRRTGGQLRRRQRARPKGEKLVDLGRSSPARPRWASLDSWLGPANPGLGGCPNFGGRFFSGQRPRFGLALRRDCWILSFFYSSALQVQLSELTSQLTDLHTPLSAQTRPTPIYEDAARG
jgi:hypothetical protein